MADVTTAAAGSAIALAPMQEDGLLQFSRKAMELVNSQYSLRPGLETVDRYYQMEGNLGQANMDAARANVMGDKSKFRDVVMPVVMPQVESALGYYISVFLSGTPIFEVSGPPDYADAALQLNSMIADQQKKTQWARQLIMFWRDGLKYNLHGIECDWTQQASYSLESQATSAVGKPKEIIWQGNALKRMDLYNTFFDPRVAPAEVHTKGEFAGYNELYSRVAMKKFMNELYGRVSSTVATRALSSGFQGLSSSAGSTDAYYIPIVNPAAIKQGSGQMYNWDAWFAGGSGLAGTGIGNGAVYRNMYQVTKLYARIIPADFGLRVPSANTPQVFKLYIVNNSVIVWAERMTNAHNFIPIIFGQPIEDGLNYQTKSFAQNVIPLQDTASALWNSVMASKRRLTHDRTYYDPSRIRSADINNPNPIAKIPVRPSAYGKNPAEAVYVSPYHDELSQYLAGDAEMLSKMADKINGQNAATQGQFTKGNRTLHEYQDVMGHSNSRNQTLSMETETQVHYPLKEIILLNCLQYPGPDEVLTPDGKSTVKVDLGKLRKAVIAFKVSDGMEPVDKNMNTDEYISAMQVAGSSPLIAAGYNMAPLFSYLMKLRGADLTPFEKTPSQQQYEQALAAWQQAAEMAAQKGTEFSTPMPQPPSQEQIQQEMQQRQAQQGGAAVALVQQGAPAGAPASQPGGQPAQPPAQSAPQQQQPAPQPAGR